MSWPARIGTGLAVLVLGLMAAGLWVSRPLHDGAYDPARDGAVDVAPIEQALTFARYRQEGALHTLLVHSATTQAVTGADLGGTDPAALFRERGFDGIAKAAVGAPPSTVPFAALDVPFEGRLDNIGIGANYAEHARESGIVEQPFVFPKRGRPTPFNSDLARAGSTLLDYEAELGLVALADITPGTTAPLLGFVLCNEATDRWALVRNLRRGTPMGTSGFFEGKSREGFAIVGPFLVVPRDVDAFFRQVELKLWLNGRLRQHAWPRDMMWDVHAVLKNIFERAGWTYYDHDATTPLLPKAGVIEAGTVIFSGTPPGVLFKPLNLWNPWAYLRPGDQVRISGSALGYIENRIVP